MKHTIPVAIIGSGNIGTDLMIKILRRGRRMRMGMMVGIDKNSDGLARAKSMGVAICDGGLQQAVTLREFRNIKIAFDATSAGAHRAHDAILREHGVQVIDLTPAAIGPYVVPALNLTQHLDAPNINMVTCGGQSTIPIVAAISRVAKVHYAEIVSSIASKGAGPGTRANIDEFTVTTAKAIEVIGGATRGKAIIILNPAEPPLMMRNTVFTLSDEADREAIEASVQRMVETVQAYVPGYRLKQKVQFDSYDAKSPLNVPGIGRLPGLKTSVFLQVEGAAHYLPSYAGNLDIMTSAAFACGESVAEAMSISIPEVAAAGGAR